MPRTPEYSDLFRDDKSVPGGSAPVKLNVHRTDLDRELARIAFGVTDEEMRLGIQVYSRPAAKPPHR